MIFEKYGIKSDDAWNTFNIKGMPARMHDIENFVLTEVDAYNRETKRLDLGREYFGTEEVKRILTNLAFLGKVKAVEELRKEFVYNSLCKDYTHEAISWIIQAYEIKGDLDFNIAMLKHWLWQVKRYIHDRQVKSPIFINFFGEHQETGKTKLVKTLSSPLEDYTTDISLTDAADDRKSRAFSENYITIIDELKMGDMGVKELQHFNAALKSLLTSDVIHYRELGKHTINRDKRIFSAIGTSNKRISKILHDPTGMRRFYEFELDCVADRDATHERVGGLLQFNMKFIWAGIDENKEDGYVSHANKYGRMLSEVQRSYRPKTVLDFFLEDPDNYNGIPVMSKDSIADKIINHESKALIENNIEPVFMMALFSELKTYAIERGEDAKYIGTLETVCNKMRSKGYHLTTFNGKSYMYLIKDSRG